MTAAAFWCVAQQIFCVEVMKSANKNSVKENSLVHMVSCMYDGSIFDRTYQPDITRRTGCHCIHCLLYSNDQNIPSELQCKGAILSTSTLHTRTSGVFIKCTTINKMQIRSVFSTEQDKSTLENISVDLTGMYGHRWDDWKLGWAATYKLCCLHLRNSCSIYRRRCHTSIKPI